MARITDRFIGPRTAYNHGGRPMVNLKYGGQYGFVSDLSQIESSTVHVNRDLVINLLDYPKAFDLMNASDRTRWISGLRALVETHPYSVTGFNGTVTLETSDTPMTAAGEMMKNVVDSKRTPTELSFAYRDLVGRAIARYWDAYISLFIMDSDTKVPLISTLGLDGIPDDWLLDYYSFSIIAFEPNLNFSRVDSAWIVRGCHPLTTGDIIGQRTPSEAATVSELTIPMAGVAENTEGTRHLAQEILTNMSLVGANPYNRRASVTGISSGIESVQDTGYAATLNNIKGQQQSVDQGNG